MNRSPAFQPRASARARSGGSSSSASKTTSPTAAIVSRAAPRPSIVVGRVPALRHEHGGIGVDVVDPQEAGEVADGTQRRQPFLDDGEQRAQLVVGRHPLDPPGVELLLDERPESIDQVVGAQPPDPLAVEPLEPLAIEDRAALVHLPDVEALDDLVERQDLLLGAGRPAEQREVVDERLGDEPLVDVGVDRGLALALAHLRAVRVEDERQVREARHVVAERSEQQDVLGRVREVVLAADDVGDLHRRVVDDDREVVQRRAVGADDHEVAAEVADVELDVAAHDVVEADHALADAEAERAAPALGLAGAPLLGGQVRAPPDVARRLLGRLLGLAVRVELLGRAVAGIGEVVGEQALRGRGVARQALHLAVRRVRAAGRLAGDLGTLVPVQAQPVQPVEDVLLELERAAGDVGVLEAEDERAADVPGVEVVEQRRARGADVERAGRARGDADSGGRSGIDRS